MHCRIIAFLATIAAVILAVPQHVRAQGNQQTVAILGLEVIDDGAGIDAETAKLATELTEALRRRATVSGAGPYRLAPNSSKDLLEMKLLGNCTNEARNCMSAIGKELGADWLMYGKIERRRDGYQVTLKLLNVEAKAMEKSTTELIQLDQASKGLITNWAGKLYNRLTGVPDQGALVIRANVSTGKVYVDNELKGGLTNNTVKIDGIASGKHQVRVEADGHEPLVIEVEIEAGKTANEELQLQMKGVGGDSSTGVGIVAGGGSGGGDVDDGGRPGGGWRVAFWTGAVLTAASGAGLAVSGMQVSASVDEKGEALEKLKMAAAAEPDGMAKNTLSDNISAIDVCETLSTFNYARSPAEDVPAVTDINSNIEVVRSACDKGQGAEFRSYVFGAATAVGALITGFALYKGYLSSGDSSEREVAGSYRAKGFTVTITPTVLPNYLGTGLKLEF